MYLYAIRAPGQCVICAALQRPQNARTPAGRPGRPSRPIVDKSYFSEVDSSEPVYAPGAVEDTDITKRKGRYTSDFIWNIDWEKQLAMEEAVKERKRAAARGDNSKEAEGDVGRISFGRLAELNSMDVDLTPQLLPRKEVQGVEEGGEGEGANAGSSGEWSNGLFEAQKPSAGEKRKWERVRQWERRSAVGQAMAAAAGVVGDEPQQSPDELAAQRAAAELAAYNNMKRDTQLLTLGLGGALTAVAALTYSQDIALSYLLGAVAGVVYLRMLHRSVDALGVGGLAGALGTNRLLVPLLLALVYNRWNTLAAAECGVHLELLPMLLGFFTYKAALVARQSASLMQEMMYGSASQRSA